MEPTTETDRVRANTPDETNREIERDADVRIRDCERASTTEITARIRELDREWDIERVLQTNAAALALTGVVLGAKFSKKWLILPGVVTSFLLQHAVQGWCPPVPLFRSMGVRTRQEIERERYALKALRGDFDGLGMAATGRADAAIRAVDRE